MGRDTILVFGPERGGAEMFDSTYMTVKVCLMVAIVCYPGKSDATAKDFGKEKLVHCWVF